MTKREEKKHLMNNGTTIADDRVLLPRDSMLATRQQRGQLKGVGIK